MGNEVHEDPILINKTTYKTAREGQFSGSKSITNNPKDKRSGRLNQVSVNATIITKLGVQYVGKLRIYTHIYVYIHIYTYIYIHTYIYIYTYTYRCAITGISALEKTQSGTES